MSDFKLKEQERDVTFYRVGDKEFSTLEKAEKYVQNVNDVLSRTYYEVVFNFNTKYLPPKYTGRYLIGVPKEENDNNPYVGIAWIPRILKEVHRTPHILHNEIEDWRIVAKYDVYTIEELLNIAKYDGSNIPDYYNEFEEDASILLTSRTPSHYEILDLTSSE